MQTIILPVENRIILPNMEDAAIYKMEFETDKYNFVFMCNFCKSEYDNLFDAMYCKHYRIISKL